GSDDDAWETARQALQLGRQVYIRDGVSDELERSGAIAVLPGEMAAATVLGVQPMLSMTPAESGHLDAAANDVEGDVAANRHVADRESTPPIAALPAGQEDILDMPLPAASEQPDEQTSTIVVPEFTLLPPPPGRGNRAAAPAARRRPSPEAEGPPAGLPPGVTLEEALLTCLTTAGGKVVGKGALLRTTGVEEAALDRALLSLIAARRIVQRTMRAGVGYVLADSESPETGVSTFQPSLFNQE
ncbi:MAG: hypothetical protein JWO42_3097, partial [Chloroflexi bacterium]|nr:hypothetical protein [Chloroflexota bacterium]